ncbi:cytochrome c [Inquilinus sp. Marseille-Q2685]|uniref:c-type cytochrome n=1 Tax=Inquilinus sp. Marseille-Q2685 TaxID=2866581 RepID=UPI001CE45F35|nr:cytochrome c [Inquilinus sp. Marseille-Q2685]
MGLLKAGGIALGVGLLLIVGGAAGLAAYAWRPPIDPVDPPAAAGFDPALVEKGAELASIGNCGTCHTAPGGRPFAGGLRLPTPFGTIVSTNITPDPGTGIGRWSEAAFGRAMREGVDREGRHLYPAFPYDHFTLVSDEDNRALYAFLMTRRPVEARAPANDLPFPLNQRFVLAGWKLLFLQPGPYRPDPARNAQWNRGAYLAEGLAHCGACHTPRNLFGAEETDRRFAGGDAEGWHAVPIGRGSPAPVPWTEESLFQYLRAGWHGLHGTAQGPMAPVADSLATVPEDDVRAIAAYVASVIGSPDAEARKRGDTLAEAAAVPAGPGTRPQSAGSQTVAAIPETENIGVKIYASACAACHESGRPAPFGGIDLRLSSAITADSPANLIRIIRGGVPPRNGAPAPIMPGFAAALSDRQLVALADHLRARFGGGRPGWARSELEATVRAAGDGEAAAAAASH